jgi:hypothetical protein
MTVAKPENLTDEQIRRARAELRIDRDTYEAAMYGDSKAIGCVCSVINVRDRRFWIESVQRPQGTPAMTATTFAALPPWARGYVVYMLGSRDDEPDVPDESNPYPDGSAEHLDLLTRYRAAHNAIHRCWTKAVGTDGYVKDDWMVLDNVLSRQFGDCAESMGYHGALLP